MLPTLRHGDAPSFCSGGFSASPSPILIWGLAFPALYTRTHLRPTDKTSGRPESTGLEALMPRSQSQLCLQLAVCPRPSHPPSLVPGKVRRLERNVLTILALCTAPTATSNLPAMALGRSQQGVSWPPPSSETASSR